MRELKRRNEELDKVKMEREKEIECLHNTVDQLRFKLTQLTQVLSFCIHYILPLNHMS